MENILFELTNEQRKYLGLTPVGKDWDLVKLFDMYLYFDGDIIRKKIIVSENLYHEQELCETTAENRTLLLPKTTKGKPKKLNFTASRSFSPFGIYFKFSSGHDVTIANYTTQTTYFYEKLDKNNENLESWLKQWIANTNEKDLAEIETFKIAKRQHCKFKEGDFFAFKIGRRNWGFGRILLDVAKLKKTEEFKKHENLGLTILMCKPLIVKVYHKISDTLNIDLNELSKCMALPPQAVMDNHYYYGENKIIGCKELTISEYDEPLISYGKKDESDTIYLQYGMIYKEMDVSTFSKYLNEDYRNAVIGFNLKLDNLEQCIVQKSNLPFWNTGGFFKERDLRNPVNSEIKREIFKFFGLDADKTYEQNLKMLEEM